MRENEEDWQGQLRNVLIEIIGLQKIFKLEGKFIVLISKLQGLLEVDNIDFLLYRKTVFETISLLRESAKYE